MLKESTKRILGGSTWNEETQNEMERESGELANVIRDYMISRSLTLEVLDEAKRLVEDVYRTNATMKKPDESGKWYPETSNGIIDNTKKSIPKP